MRAENLDSAILVMKAAENRSRCDGAEPLNRPMNRSVLAQSPMSSRFIVVGGKLAKDLAQMGLTEHNQVVETFPSDRADQSLRVPILPRRARSNRFVADAHGAQSVRDSSAVDAVPITDQVARRLSPRECFGDLACDPVRGRMGCDC